MLHKVRREHASLSLRCRACRLRSKLAGREVPRTGLVGSQRSKETTEIWGEVESLKTSSGMNFTSMTQPLWHPSYAQLGVHGLGKQHPC